MKKFYHDYLGLLLVLAISTPAFAQLNYPVSNFQVVAGTYTDLGTNGTQITVANNNDANSAPQNIGFTFDYNGVSYNQFVLNTNGVIKFGTVAPSVTNLFTASAQNAGAGVGGPFNTADSNMVAAFCHDLTGSTGAEFRFHTTGSVGSRVCTIQFKNLTENTTNPAVQYSSINFQIRLYETSNIIEVVYGTFTSTTNASAFKSAVVGLKGSSTAANQILSITKGSVTAWNAATAAQGNYTGNNFNFGNNVGGARPIPVSGTTYRFIPTYANDIAIRQVYTLGKLPIPFAAPHAVRAAIRNSGTQSAVGVTIYLQISGANSFTDSVNIAGINSGTDTIITFLPYTPMVVGRNIVKVFTNIDNNVFNDTAYYTQDINLNTYNYADPTIQPAGGVGFTGATGDFVAKFNYSGTNSINQIGVNFNTGGTSLKIGIWDTTASGTPGVKLWESNAFITQAGLNTIPVNPPIPINGSFFVGVIQTGTTNAAFSFQNENPIRNQTFYYTSPTGNTMWTDFFATQSAFRFMIEPRLQVANDIGATEITSPCNAVISGQSASVPAARLYNYGSIAQSGFMAYCKAFNNLNTVVFTDSVFVAGIIAPNNYLNIVFNNSINFSTPGNYTFKIWTNLANDADHNNDTAVMVVTATAPVIGINSGTRLQFDGFDDMVQIANNPTINPQSAFTIETWVRPLSLVNVGTLYSKDSTALLTSHSLTLSGLTPVFTVRTSNGQVTLTSNDTVSLGVWNHIAAVYDGTNMHLYVNGDTAGSIAQTGNVINYNVPAYIGRLAGVAQSSNAGIENFRYWNVARSQTQIIQQMHYILPFAASPNLMVNYRFDGGVNTSLVIDESGNCNTGVLMNMDIGNTTANPAWFISSLPLDTTEAQIVNIIGSTPTAVLGKNMSVTYHNYLGGHSLAVNYIRSTPLGFAPDTAIAGLGTGYRTSHNRHWIVYTYGNPSYDSIDVTLNLLPNQLVASPVLNELYLTERHSGSSFMWNIFKNPATNANSLNSQVTFTLGANQTLHLKQLGVAGYNNPLPVKYNSFNAFAKEKDAVLMWSTASEKNNKGFIVERSFDGSRFEAIGFVNGVGTSNIVNRYQFIDENSAELGYNVIYYRLNQQDFNGESNLSSVVLVDFNKNNFEHVKVNPNPFANDFQIEVLSFDNQFINIEITDQNGKLVSYRTEQLYSGSNIIQCDDLNAVKSGIYFVKIVQHSGSKVFKVVKL
jgi:hypothetical protein